MRDVFLHGPLQHVPLLEAVLGRPCNDVTLAGADLADHAAVWAQGQPFAILVPRHGTSAGGRILRDARPEDLARIAYYQSVFFCAPARLCARTGDARTVPVDAFLPQDAPWRPAAPWSYAAWQSRWATLCERVAREAMVSFDAQTDMALAARLPMIRRRTAAFLARQARGQEADHRPAADKVRILERRRVHDGFFALDRVRLTHPRYDGRSSAVLDREVFHVGEAVSFPIYDPVRDAVLLVEQFRPNVFAAGDPSAWVIEPVAGLVDPGETPQEAARREALEEAGARLTALEDVGGCYCSTGSSTEFVHLFVAVGDIGDLDPAGGLESEGEDIRVLRLPFAEFRAQLHGRRFRDMPLIATGLWLDQNRARLRAMG